MRDITVFGAGYVGLVTGACLAKSGHRVTVLEIDEHKIASLSNCVVPFHEPGLSEIVTEALAAGRLAFTHPDNVEKLGDFVYVAVGTPSTAGGAADLRYVHSAIATIAERAPRGGCVVMKSTVPPGTGGDLSEKLAPAGLSYVSNPEFLREGNAIEDWYHTDRIVLGGDGGATTAVAALYEDIPSPVLECDITSAELIKYASNAFLATKISFANEIARLCDACGADVTTVATGVGMDSRIGPAFLKAGIGYGGSCFPKDTRALDFLASINDFDFHLLKAVIDVNARQRLLPLICLRKNLGTFTGLRVAVLGLTFKPNTDDVREAPAEEIVRMLLAEGAHVTSYDPVGSFTWTAEGYVQADSLQNAVSGAAAVIVATEWSEISGADWGALVGSMVAPRLVFDGRNCVDPATVRDAGGAYVGVGRR